MSASPPSSLPTDGARARSELGRRAVDRERVRQRRAAGKRWRLLWLLVGPGVLVMLGENDAPSMLSYAATGANLGVGFFLPFVVATFAAAYAVQEMTVRVGSVTQRGHAELIFSRFGATWGWFSFADLALGNFLTVVTELIGLRSGLGFFGVPAWASVLTAMTLVVLVSGTARYRFWERTVLLLAIGNVVFVPVAVLAHPNWGHVGMALLTWHPLPNGPVRQTILLLVADVGATVTPWMLFFQQGAVTDKGLLASDIRYGRLDTALGAIAAALCGIAVVVATSVLAGHHAPLSNPSAANFAQRLAPQVGHLGASLFALGVAEAGLVALILISTSSAFAFGEVTQGPRSLNRSLREGKAFYAVLILNVALASAVVLLPGAPLLLVVLLVNVVAVLAMPPALLLLLLLANDAELMGPHVNTRLANVILGAIGAGLIAAGLAFGVSVVAQGLGL